MIVLCYPRGCTWFVFVEILNSHETEVSVRLLRNLRINGSTIYGQIKDESNKNYQWANLRKEREIWILVGWLVNEMKTDPNERK